MAPGVGYLYQKMMPLDLTMTRKLALAALLTLRKPLPPSKAYAPPRATGARRRRSAVPLLGIVADNQQKTARNRGLRAEHIRGFKAIHRSPSRAAILRATAGIPPTRRLWLTSITIASPSPSRWRAGGLRPADGSGVSAAGNARQCGPVRWVRYSLGRSFLAALPLKRTARHQRCTTLS